MAWRLVAIKEKEILGKFVSAENFLKIDKKCDLKEQIINSNMTIPYK